MESNAAAVAVIARVAHEALVDAPTWRPPRRPCAKWCAAVAASSRLVDIWVPWRLWVS